MIIYKITNLINGKIYIGKQTLIRKNDKYFGSGVAIKEAIEKYGINNFKKEILDKAENLEDLKQKEIYWINEFQSFKSEIGYNRSKGGDGFSGITNETIEKIRLKNLGKKRTNEQRDNISKSLVNKPKSEDHKKSLSKAWEKRKIEKPHSEKTLKKMSDSMKGKNIGKNIQIHKFLGPDKNTYTTEEGFIKFAKSKHIHPENFRELIRGEKNEYKGWKF